MDAKKVIAAIPHEHLEAFHNLVVAMSKGAVFAVYTREERTVETHTRGWAEWEETYTDHLAVETLGNGILVTDQALLGLANVQYYYRRVENQDGGTIVSHGNRRRAAANTIPLRLLHDLYPELFLSKYFQVAETDQYGWTAWVYPRIQFNPVAVDKLLTVLQRRDSKTFRV